jgi:mxaA protein
MRERACWCRGLVAVLLAASASLAGAQPITITPQPVRAFGYSLGDRIERRIDIRAVAPWSFDRSSVPVPGRQNAWFDLVDASFQPAGSGGELRLVYQLLNSPVQPVVMQLPPLALRFAGAAQPVERDVAPANISAAPLLPAAAAGSTLDAPRADRKPEPVPVNRLQSRLTAYALAAAFIVAWMVIGNQLAQRRRAGPFVRACRELRRLAHAPPASVDGAAAMRIVHRALDETAGETIFRENVETLFASPHRAPLRERTLAFLDRSRLQFFAGGGEALSVPELRDLARAWRSLEAGRR